MRALVSSSAAAIIAPMLDAPVSFGGFRFDPATGELSGPNGSTRLGPQPAQVLSILIAKRGTLVTRAELKAALWPDTVVEADQGLNFCVRQIRAALGDEGGGGGGEGRFIETLPRRGYRFVFPREEIVQPVATSESAQGRRPRFGVLAAIIAGLVALVGAVAWMTASRAGPTDVKVALLPLVPSSGDPAWVADVDGRVTERLIDRLTEYGSGAIGVVGPVTTSRYAGDQRAHTEIGRELGVAYVMSGGVRASDSTVFIQLIRVSDGVHVFAFRRRVVGANLDSLAAAVVVGAAAKVAR